MNTAGDGVWTEGDPFVGVQSDFYWSDSEFDDNKAWFVTLFSGSVNDEFKDLNYYVWPVRGGEWCCG